MFASIYFFAKVQISAVINNHFYLIFESEGYNFRIVSELKLLDELIPSLVDGFWGIFPGPWGKIKMKSFSDNSSVCGAVVHLNDGFYMENA
jgi:hypothetical protein